MQRTSSQKWSDDLVSERPIDAIEQLAEIVASSPRNAWAFCQLAYAYRISGNPLAACDAATMSIELYPDQIAARVELVLSLVSLGKLADAITAADDLCERFPDDPHAWSAKAIVLADLDSAEATRLAEAAWSASETGWCGRPGVAEWMERLASVRLAS
jgi:predicted Zn-dependent protease